MTIFPCYPIRLPTWLTAKCPLRNYFLCEFTAKCILYHLYLASSCKPCAQKPNPQPSISKFKCIYSSVWISRFNLSKCKEEREKKRLAQINSDINLSIPTNCRSYFIIFVISFICERKPFKVQFILSNGGISSIYIFST